MCQCRPRVRLALPLALALAGLMAALAALAVAEGEDAPVREGPVVQDPRGLGIGELVSDLPFTDVDGKAGTLSEVLGAKGLVIAVRTVGCPLSKKYAPRLEALRGAWEPQGFGFLLVNPALQDDLEEIRAARERYGLRARLAKDEGQRIAQALQVRTTTEVFVLDRARTLVYRGAIDDQYGLGYARAAPRERHLENALAAVLRDERPRVAATSAPGCVLKVPAPGPPSTDVTYHGRVSRILDRNCVDCHREGENGPFPLDTYEDARGNAGMVRLMVERRLMPPWFASQESHAFRNDRSLSEHDRTDLLRWVDADCPEGDAADAPVPIARVDGWRIGKPDVVFETPRELRVPAEGVVEYQYVNVPTDYAEDRYVRAMEVRLRSPQVVHHVLVFVRYPKGHPLHLQAAAQDRNGLQSYFAGMIPGQSTVVYPPGLAKRLPQGAILRFQIHFTPDGEERVERPRVGLVFHDGPPRHEVRTRGLFNGRFRIPPGEPDFPVRASWMVPVRARILGFMPHMHLRGKSARYSVLRPGGEEEVVLDVPRYDFNWQLFYELREPLDLPAKTIVRARFHYDNSDANPANPDPSRTVRFGEQTTDEMMIGYLDWYPLDGD